MEDYKVYVISCNGKINYNHVYSNYNKACEAKDKLMQKKLEEFNKLLEVDTLEYATIVDDSVIAYEEFNTTTYKYSVNELTVHVDVSDYL